MQFTSEAGNVYTFQRVLPSKWLSVLDGAEVGGQRSRVKIYPAILENVVVQPAALKVDDFEDEEGTRGGFAELDEVVTAAIRFQQGK